jgi:gliding motility-associated-like protein
VEETYVQIEFEPDRYTIELGDSLYLTPKINSNNTDLSYQWVVNEEGFTSCSSCPETWLLPLFSGDFYLNVTTEQNCQDEASVQVEVEKPRRIYIPNAFSPNGDGVNDLFYIMGNGFAKVKQLTIADRWGNVVFQNNGCSINDSTCSWDGSLKGRPLNPGVFIYTTQIEFLDGATQQYSGLINLIR